MELTTLDDREFALKLAWNMWGQPYVWGGDDPVAGFDCSGWVIEILKSVGRLPSKGDWKAWQIYERFYKNIVIVPRAGCLVFFGGPPIQDIYHIVMMIDDKRTIGESGGGSATKTEADAIKQNAYAKFRPLSSLSTPFAIVDPFRNDPSEA